MNIPLWLDTLLLNLGFGHECRYDDSTHPDYIGFTAGVCYEQGFHRGRRPLPSWRK